MRPIQRGKEAPLAEESRAMFSRSERIQCEQSLQELLPERSLVSANTLKFGVITVGEAQEALGEQA